MKKQSPVKPRRGPGPLARRLEYLSWPFIAQAVLGVYDENANPLAIKMGGFRPDMDVWVMVDELRLDIWTRTRRTWSRLTGKNFTHFPYSIDYVCRLYRSYQNVDDEKLIAFREELEKLTAVDDSD